MNLPHQLVVITPREVPDAYDNPAPALDYGPDAPRRAVAGLLLPRDTARGSGGTDPTPGRAPVTGAWWLLTTDPIRARERVLFDGRTFTVDGEPAQFAPRPGFTHYETVLTHTEG
ncbi:hypothetical protein [Amycolatopsis sp. PS_44_ISF1]|uniref:hypothetical protein n=1 Tax=Amycolatopsis sp. PS_44_ISF1 TaxID=2974917 RepID=UPI0028DEBCB5|nr:hypothetical protein [Amycolatopsis sp. PS_44_ISF1]MDT8910892.1 hypothetical protein [Amycolatopsis sp. PS_44_ISF1]